MLEEARVASREPWSRSLSCISRKRRLAAKLASTRFSQPFGISPFEHRIYKAIETTALFYLARGNLKKAYHEEWHKVILV